MALDRTWYNTLVDDDGSGLTGSVWDKADVDALMDATDAEIVRLDAGPRRGTWVPTAGNSTSAIAVILSNCAYAVVGDAIHYRLQLRVSNAASSGPIFLTMPPYGAYQVTVDEILVRLSFGAHEVGYLRTSATASQFEVFRLNGQAFDVREWDICGQGFYFWR
jgi:hypothetical protein